MAENDTAFKPDGGAEAPPDMDEAARANAAGMIQRTYRGHRTRNALKGYGLDPSTKWLELVKDAQYQKLTTPAPPKPRTQSQEEAMQGSSTQQPTTATSPARSQWQRVTQIARRAGHDDHSPTLSEVSSEELSDEGLSPEDRKAQRERQERAREARKRTAKMMDLQYFLEMVDQKHRYGSHLRKYHNYWKTQDTTQNFFYWLDQGDGKDVELPECSRERLDRNQVRYLSREERQNYLVKVDKEGLLVWAKNGERVWTKDELYKDSINGIVPVSDPTPKFKYNVRPENYVSEPSSSESDSESEEDGKGDEGRKGDEAAGYVNEDFHRARGLAKIKHVSAAALFNHMVRDSMKKGRKWVFVADTSFRLYVGYKQSGSFQHSSFLHGSRITAAGLIKIKRGQLRALAPLSGHYRPPANNFRDFVHSLRDEGVDMSRVSISKSYAILIGMESYTRTKKRVSQVGKNVVLEKDKLLHPDKVKSEQEAAKDRSQSAEKERQYLERQRLEQEKQAKERKKSGSLSARFSRTMSKLTGHKEGDLNEEEHGQVTRVLGTGPEDGIPVPEGKR